MNRITNVTWTKNEMPIQAGLKDQVDFGFDGSISIANVQKRHSGLYRYLIKIVKLVRLKIFHPTNIFFFRCTVSTKMDNATATVPVKVIVNAPQIQSFSGNQTLFSGNSLVLMCKANGIPEPEVIWMFNNTDAKVKSNEYVIANAILSDSGKYECIAKNQYGQTK